MSINEKIEKTKRAIEENLRNIEETKRLVLENEIKLGKILQTFKEDMKELEMMIEDLKRK